MGWGLVSEQHSKVLCTGLLNRQGLLNRLLKSPGHGMLKSTGHGMLKSTQVANQWEGRPSAALLNGGGGSTCHGLLISTCRGLLISTDSLINLDALINLFRVSPICTRTVVDGFAMVRHGLINCHDGVTPHIELLEALILYVSVCLWFYLHCTARLGELWLVNTILYTVWVKNTAAGKMF